jgi:hypothetical protein
MKLDWLDAVLEAERTDLLSTEKQLTDALPDIARVASSEQVFALGTAPLSGGCDSERHDLAEVYAV